MELIVAVYDDWGIGCEGTQPIALSVDRKFFRETTRGAMVIAGRKTIGDFPGKKPLPGRVNVALTRSDMEIPGFTVCHSPEEAMELAKTTQRCFVIGGGSITSRCCLTVILPISPRCTRLRLVIPGFPIWTRWKIGPWQKLS